MSIYARQNRTGTHFRTTKIRIPEQLLRQRRALTAEFGLCNGVGEPAADAIRRTSSQIANNWKSTMIHFSDDEMARRRSQLERELEARELDGILCFAQESMYWLTGYDTFGFCFFQCLVVGGEHPVLLTRSADRLQAKITSNVDDVRIWMDDDLANPALDLASLIRELRLDGKKLGIEIDTHGLTAANYIRVNEALEGVVELVDASDLFSKLRLIKSEEELTYVRKAATLADDALDAATSILAPGVDESAVLAAMQGAVFAGGGDYPGNEFIIGSGENALLVRFAAGRRKLGAQDQLTLEWAGTYRHYHAAMMRTAIIGQPSPLHQDMHEAAREALLNCEHALRPGNPMEAVFDAHAETLDRAGFGDSRLNACGYSLGARFTPSWMEREMFRKCAATILQPGMVMFIHIILVDETTQTAMTVGRTSLVGHHDAQPLSRHSLKMVQA